jgi:hypothetical protein
MTKRYKLLKDTIDHSSGAEFEFTTTRPGGFYRSISPGRLGDFRYFERDLVENNPEWFEEVKQKEWWEKLGVKFDGSFYSHPQTNTYRTLGPVIEELRHEINKKWPREWEVVALKSKHGSISYWASGRGYTMEELTRDGWSIYSVKRLSDGEVFTVGEWIEFFNRFVGSINRFEIDSFDKNNIIAIHGHYQRAFRRWKKAGPSNQAYDGIKHKRYSFDEFVWFDAEKKFTKKEVEERERLVFEAARTYIGGNPYNGFLYPKFDDYKKLYR